MKVYQEVTVDDWTQWPVGYKLERQVNSPSKDDELVADGSCRVSPPL